VPPLSNRRRYNLFSSPTSRFIPPFMSFSSIGGHEPFPYWSFFPICFSLGHLNIFSQVFPRKAMYRVTKYSLKRRLSYLFFLHSISAAVSPWILCPTTCGYTFPGWVPVFVSHASKVLTLVGVAGSAPPIGLRKLWVPLRGVICRRRFFLLNLFPFIWAWLKHSFAVRRMKGR